MHNIFFSVALISESSAQLDSVRFFRKKNPDKYYSSSWMLGLSRFGETRPEWLFDIPHWPLSFDAVYEIIIRNISYYYSKINQTIWSVSVQLFVATTFCLFHWWADSVQRDSAGMARLNTSWQSQKPQQCIFRLALVISVLLLTMETFVCSVPTDLQHSG